MPTSPAYHLQFELHPQQDDVDLLGKGIMAYATEKKGLPPLKFFAIYVRDQHNAIVGGCNGTVLYGCLHVDQLWMSTPLRGQGFGSQLMQAAERFGLEQHCTFATVNTMDWEALGFYQRLGYAIEFERHGYDKDSIFYFLRKPLP